MKPKSVISALVQELESVLTGLHPAIVPGFRDPATLTEMEAVEQAIGLKFPGALRDLLACHNGQHSYSTELGYADPVLPALRIPTGHCSHFWLAGLEDIRENTLVLRQEYEEYWQHEEFTTIGPVRNHDKFIVFTTTENADWLVLDLDPAEGGKGGQVVIQCTQPCELIVVADSLEHYLRLICDGYQSKRFKVQSTEHYVTYSEDGGSAVGL